MNLRELARNKQCMVRLVGICNFDPATTVLAHFRMAGISGAGMKPPDLIGAWACHSCHDVVDGRRMTDMTREAVRLAFLEGVVRTQAALISYGAVKS
jgi:hypothetical protein